MEVFRLSTARRAVVYDGKWIVAAGVQQDGDLPRRGGEPSDRAADLQTVAGVEEDRLVRASNPLFE